MPQTIWLQIPPENVLEERSRWRSLGNKTFSTVRFHILVRKNRDKKLVNGPLIKELKLPGGAEYQVAQKKVHIVKHSDTIQQSIQETVTTKLAQEVAQKIASEIGSNGVLASAKLASEVRTKSGLELTEAVQESLTVTRSYEIEDSKEITQSVTWKAGTDGNVRPSITLRFYLGLWRWNWDVYLYKVEYLRLRYEKNWVWPDVRKTISEVSAEPKLPLFRVSFYEPQDEFSMSEGSYVPDINDEGDEVRIEPLPDHIQRTSCPTGASLESLARLAFPVTKQERTDKKGKHLAAGMTKTQLVRYMAEEHELSNKQAAAFLESLAEVAIKETKKNGVFVVPGLGRLVKSSRKARMGRNPQTGTALKVPAKTVVKFRVAKAAKDLIAPKK
jgi:DNA-binding protein HU-beta